ncbi:MAG TPA: hypothetical protein VJ770_05980 [Stellaceae bacterium]|nr:hypothetical protein [Stellaceae bacterium]
MSDPPSGRAAPSRAALRQRRYRERRKAGEMLIELRAPVGAIAQLAALGWLDPERRDDRNAVGAALAALASAALGAGLRPRK